MRHFNWYGLWFAKHFLHLCSAEKIKDFLQNEEINLQPNQVIHLFDKNAELFVNYLDYYKTNFKSVYKNRKVTHHITLVNLEFAINLNEKEKIVLGKLGKRTSKKAFEIMKNGILEDKYKTTLNEKVLYKKLGSKFRRYYYDRFPKFYSDLNVCHEFSVLQNIPKIKRWPTFSEAFSGRFPDHDIKNISISDLIKHCPDRNLIKTRALEVYNEDKNENWLQYVEPKLSIPLLKERINVTSDISGRRKLVVLLIETCAENKDLVSFEAVLKYICYRHRNEENEFRYTILNKILELFDLQELNENHWNYLNEQIQMNRIRKTFYWCDDSPFVERHIEYLFRNKKDFSVALQEYVDDIVNYGSIEFRNLKDPVIMQKILIEVLKLLRATETSEYLDCNIIESMITFNELHPQYRVMYSNFSKFDQVVSDIFAKTSDIYDYKRNLIEKLILHKISFPESLPMINNSAIRQVIFNVALQPHFGTLLSKALNVFILKKSRTTFENDLLTAYFEQLFDKYPESNIINWYLANEPQTIVNYFPKIIARRLSSTVSYSNLLLIKYYSHFKFDTQVIDYLKQQLTTVAYNQKDVYVKCLRMMLNTDEFAQIITEQFLPEKEKLDSTDKRMVDMYKLQCDIAKTLHKVEEPHKMLQIVVKFCIGDYLQSALSSLYSVFYKSPEVKLYGGVEELSKRAGSVNKHAVFLSCELLTQEFIIGILTNTNASGQKRLFSATLKYFQKNPSETLLNMVLGTMSTIDKDDRRGLDSLVRATISKPFKVPYVEKCWTFYESLEPLKVDVDRYLASILNHLLKDTDLLKNVSKKFIQNILNSCLPSKKVGNIMELAVKVLIYREYEQIENFDLIFRIISTKDPVEARSFLELFTTEKLDIKFVRLLDQYWHQYLTITDNFWGHLFLKLWLIDQAKDSEEKFAENIVNYMEQIVSEYDCYIFSLFQDVFVRFLNEQNDEYKYKLFYNILKVKTNSNTCVLILNIMAPSPRQHECREVFQKILGIIRNLKEPIISIYYSKYLSDHGLVFPKSDLVSNWRLQTTCSTS